MEVFMEVLLFLWIAVNVVALIVIISFLEDGADFSFVNPIVIYNNIKVNWFGALLLAIVCNCSAPYCSNTILDL